MVASSPVRHEPPGGMQGNPVEVQTYQTPWKALSEFAMQGDMDQPHAPFQQLVSNGNSNSLPGQLHYPSYTLPDTPTHVSQDLHGYSDHFSSLQNLVDSPYSPHHHAQVSQQQQQPPQLHLHTPEQLPQLQLQHQSRRRLQSQSNAGLGQHADMILSHSKGQNLDENGDEMDFGSALTMEEEDDTVVYLEEL